MDREERAKKRAAKQLQLPTQSSRKPPPKKAKSTHEDEDLAKALEESRQEQLSLKLQLNILAKQNARAKARKSEELTEDEKRWRHRINKGTKTSIFRHCKFIFDEKKLMKATKKLLLDMDLHPLQDLKGAELNKKLAELIPANMDLVRTCLNDTRNYAVSQLRECVVSLMMNGEKVPTPEQLAKCAFRCDVEKDKEMTSFFDMYVDQFLMKVAMKECWDTNIRHYQEISKALLPDTTSPTLCIPGPTEAFLLLVYTNGYHRWKYMAKMKKKGETIDRKDPQYQVPFCDNDRGQSKWGGWNLAGRQFFKEALIKVSEGRSSENCATFEANVLQRLRDKHDIVARDSARANRGKKRRAVVEEVESDNEFEEWD